MPIAQETKEIRGLSVEVTQFPAFSGFAILSKIVKVTEGRVGTVARNILSQLHHSEAQKLMRELLVSTRVKIDDKMIQMDSIDTIDQAFSGNMTALIETLEFIVEVNFIDADDEEAEDEEADVGEQEPSE